jgi:hypothetical protein
LFTETFSDALIVIIFPLQRNLTSTSSLPGAMAIVSLSCFMRTSRWAWMSRRKYRKMKRGYQCRGHDSWPKCCAFPTSARHRVTKRSFPFQNESCPSGIGWMLIGRKKQFISLFSRVRGCLSPSSVATCGVDFLRAVLGGAGFAFPVHLIFAPHRCARPFEISTSDHSEIIQSAPAHHVYKRKRPMVPPPSRIFRSRSWNQPRDVIISQFPSLPLFPCHRKTKCRISVSLRSSLLRLQVSDVSLAPGTPWVLTTLLQVAGIPLRHRPTNIPKASIASRLHALL